MSTEKRSFVVRGCRCCLYISIAALATALQLHHSCHHDRWHVDQSLIPPCPSLYSEAFIISTASNLNDRLWGRFEPEFMIMTWWRFLVLDQMVEKKQQQFNPQWCTCYRSHQKLVSENSNLSHTRQKNLRVWWRIMIHTKPQAIPGPVDP